MSFTFTFTGVSSELSAEFNPPIYLDPVKDYVMGLTNFECFNSIPNVTSSNNQLKFADGFIALPEGSYEISDINKYINSQIDINHHDFLRLKANHNTLKTSIKSNRDIDFNIENSIGPLLGFKKRKLSAGKVHESDYTAKIIKVNSLLIDCNITIGSYTNGTAAHTIYQFFPSVPPGYKIIESPLHVTYLPISVPTISKITLKILDQDGDLVNFRGETVTIGLHLKSVNNGVQI